VHKIVYEPTITLTADVFEKDLTFCHSIY